MFLGPGGVEAGLDFPGVQECKGGHAFDDGDDAGDDAGVVSAVGFDCLLYTSDAADE